jgi:hypothetical protein
MRVIYTSNFSKLKFSDDEIVSYLGYDFMKIVQLSQNGNNILDSRSRISAVAHEIKYDFIDYISSIGKKQNNQVSWWASRIASKSNLQTDFFSCICLLITFEKLAADNSSSIIIIDDYRLYQLITLNFVILKSFTSNARAKLSCLKNVIFSYFKIFPVKMKFVLSRYLEDIENKKIFKSSHGNFTYIYSWIEGRSITSDGVYCDPYFPGVNKYSHSKKFVLFCGYNTESYLKTTIAKMMIIDGFSSYSSFKKILKASTQKFKPTGILKYKGLDLTPLWSKEILTENSESSFISKIHENYCWNKFFRTSSGRILYPFENQPWEKMMLLALRKYTSQMRSIGSLHTTTHKLLLPFHTTQSEASYIPLPDVLFVNSPTAEKLYKGYFRSRALTIIDAGSLRFPFSENQIERNEKKIPTVGIMLSCIRSQTNQQLYDLAKNNDMDVIYLVKSHPDTPIQPDIKLKNVKYYDGSANDFYKHVDAIVYCSSTSGLEAWSSGLPVFRLMTQYLDLETGEDDFSPIVVNSISEINRSQLVAQLPKNVFSSIREDIWLDYLN